MFTKQIIKIISSVLMGAFLFNIFSGDLALAKSDPFLQTDSLSIWTLTDKPTAEHKAFIASLYRENRLIWKANSDKYNNMLEKYKARAVLLSTGRYLMTPETAKDDLELIKAVTHEDVEILMQREEKLHPARYKRLMRKILKGEETAKIRDLYNTLSDYKDISSEPDNIIFNDLIAKAFELYFITEEHIVDPETELTEEERTFLELMRPILTAKDSRGRYKNFSKLFFNIDERMKFVLNLQKNKEEKFYRVASKIQAAKQGSEKPPSLKNDSTSQTAEMLIRALEGKRDVISKDDGAILTLFSNSALTAPHVSDKDNSKVEAGFFKLLKETPGLYFQSQITPDSSGFFENFWLHNIRTLIGSIDMINYMVKKRTDNKSVIEKFKPKKENYTLILNLFSRWIDLNKKEIEKYFKPLTIKEEKELFNHLEEYEQRLDIKSVVRDYVIRTSPAETKLVQQAVEVIDNIVRKENSLSKPISRFHGIIQRPIENTTKLHLCVPIEVFKNSADVASVLRKLGRNKKGGGIVPFELVVTGVKEEDDIKRIKGFNSKAIKDALGLSKKLNVTYIREEQIQLRAKEYSGNLEDKSGIDTAARIGIIKDLYLERLGNKNQGLLPGEYMTITTGDVSKDETESLKKVLSGELKDNISISVLVKPESGEWMFSLSAIIEDWLSAIQEDIKSAIRIVDLPPITSMIGDIRKSVENFWRVLLSV